MRTKKLNSGFEMPVLGIGTFGFGGEHEADFSNDKECIQAIKDALDLGFTHIDTAEVYGGGHTEELIAEAIKGRDRKRLFITSKVYNNHFRYDDLIRSANGSITRLKAGYLDLCLLHSYNPEVPLKEAMEALNKMVQEKKVKDIGVCNFKPIQLMEAQKYSQAKIVVNQMKFSLWAETGPDVDTFRYCQENDIIITAYKIFGRDKINTENILLLEKLALKYSITQAQLMIAWVLSKKNFVSIFSAMSKKYLEDNMKAIKMSLRQEDISLLDKELLIKRFKR